MTREAAEPRTITTAIVGSEAARAEMRQAVQTILAPFMGDKRIHWVHHDVTTAKEAESVTPDAILAAPSSATWSRSRHLHSDGPRPLRSSSWPWGLPELTGADREKVEADNDELRLALMLIEAGLKRSSNMTWFLIFPEDRGRGAQGHPASIWQLRELRCWAASNNAVRGAVNQCELGPSDSPRPLGFLKHQIDSGSLSQSPFVSKGWPTFSSSRSRHYIGPLPRKCRCGNDHRKWNEAFAEDKQMKSSTVVLSKTAEWLAQQVLRPHLRPQSTRSALLRKGPVGDLPRSTQNDSAENWNNGTLPLDATDDTSPVLSDADTEDTWPEPEDTGEFKEHYVDVKLVDALGIRNKFPNTHYIDYINYEAPYRTVRTTPNEGG